MLRRKRGSHDIWATGSWQQSGQNFFVSGNFLDVVFPSIETENNSDPDYVAEKETDEEDDNEQECTSSHQCVRNTFPYSSTL